jgi:hypothetical protein
LIQGDQPCLFKERDIGIIQTIPVRATDSCPSGVAEHQKWW